MVVGLNVGCADFVGPSVGDMVGLTVGDVVCERTE